MPEIINRFGELLDVEVYFDKLWKLITPFNEANYDRFYVDKTHVRSLAEWAEIRAIATMLPSRTQKTASLWEDYLLFIKTIWPIKGVFCDEFAIALGNLLEEFNPQHASDFRNGSMQRFKQYVLSLPRADIEHTLANVTILGQDESPILLSALLDCWSAKQPTPETFEQLILWLAGTAPRLLPKGSTFDAIYKKHRIGPHISNILLEAHLNDLPCTDGSEEFVLKHALMQDLAGGLALLSPEGLDALRKMYACRSARIQDTDADYFAQPTLDNQQWFYFLQLISQCVEIQNPYAWLVPGLDCHEIAEEGLYWEFPPSRFIVSGDGRRLLYLPYLAKAILGRASESGEVLAKAVQCFDGETYRAFEFKEIERLQRSAFWHNQGLAACLDKCFDEKTVLTLSEKTVKQIQMLLEGVFYSVGLFVEKSYSEEQNQAAIKAFTNFIVYLDILRDTCPDEYQRLMKYPVTIRGREETFARWLEKVQDPARHDNCVAVFSNALLEIVLDYYPQTKFNSPEISAFKQLESQRSRSACYAIRDFAEASTANYEHRIIRLAVSLFTKAFSTSYGLGKTTIKLATLTNDVTESGLHLWRFLEQYLEPGYSKRPHFLAFIWANCIDLIKVALATPSFGRLAATTAWLESLLKIDTAEEHKAVKIHEGKNLLAAMLDNAALIKQKKSSLYECLMVLLKDVQKTIEKPQDDLLFKQHLEIHVLWYKLIQTLDSVSKLKTTLNRYIKSPEEAGKKILNTHIADVSAKKDDSSFVTELAVSAIKGVFFWASKTPALPDPRYVSQTKTQPS